MRSDDASSKPRRVGRTIRILALPWLVLVAAFVQAEVQDDGAAVPIVNPSSSPQGLTVVGDCLYFTADDGIHGRELWCADSNGGCFLTVDLNPGAAGSNPDPLHAAGGWIYFVAEARTGDRAMYLWHPESRAAKKVLNPATGAGFRKPILHGTLAGALYFTGEDTRVPRELWTTVLGQPEVTRLADLGACPNANIARSLLIEDSHLMMYSTPGRIWCANGPPSASRLLVDFRPVSPRAQTDWIGTLGDQVVFGVDDGVHGIEPWITDGTPEGTRLLKDIASGAASSGLAWLHPCGKRLLMSADDGEHGLELWGTDGTESGTQLVRDLCPGRSGGNPHYFLKVGKWSYFVADDGIHGKEIWRTDGTPEGTSVLKDAHPGVGGSDPYGLCAAGETLYFCNTTPEYGDEVWVSDGTEEGTRLFKDINPGNAAGGPNSLRWVNGRLYFTYNDPRFGEELWVSDGTPRGTRMALDIYPPRYNSGSHPRQLTAFRDRVVFAARDKEHGEELWSSDGTEAGTVPVADLVPGESGSEPQNLAVAGEMLYFSARSLDRGRELWVSDGTESGTRCVVDLAPGEVDSAPGDLTAVDGRLYFTARSSANLRALWCSDGTAEGTTRLTAADRDASTGDVSRVFQWRSRLYFYAAEGNNRTGLWEIGTHGEPTCLVRGESGAMTWDLAETAPRPDLAFSPANADMVALVLAVRPSTAGQDATPSLTVNSDTYFVARTNRYGAELWRTDGTRAGTRLVCDAFPGAGSSSPALLTKLGDAIYFVADHPTNGRVLWRTDGTSAGSGYVKPVFPGGTSANITPFVSAMAVLGESLMLACPGVPTSLVEDTELHRLEQQGFQDVFVPLRDLRSGSKGSWPRQLTVVGERVFFAADDGVHGEELWVSDGTDDGTHLVKDISPPGDLSPFRR